MGVIRSMKFVSWNVNGIRACLRKGFLDFARTADADVLCLQETRAEPHDVELSLDGYHAYWNPAKRKGYSGTAVFTRAEPLDVRLGMGMPAHDTEGRVMTLVFPEWFLVNVYTPNAGRALERLAYRTREWDVAFLAYVKKLEKNRPVVLCGDLNVAHKEIDLARPKANERSAGFTIEERRGFDRIVESGFIDTFREFEQDGGHYSWWSYVSRARDRNVGWRIDYFCISAALRPRLASATILSDVLGSDHCPVNLELGD